MMGYLKNSSISTCQFSDMVQIHFLNLTTRLLELLTMATFAGNTADKTGKSQRTIQNKKKLQKLFALLYIVLYLKCVQNKLIRGLVMNLEKMRLEEIKLLEGELAENVVEKIKLAGKGRLEWIRASLSKSEDKPLSGKYTFITKNPVAEEYIPDRNKLDFLMSTLLELSQKKELTASVYPDKSIRIQ